MSAFHQRTFFSLVTTGIGVSRTYLWFTGCVLERVAWVQIPAALPLTIPLKPDLSGLSSPVKCDRIPTSWHHRQVTS